MPLLRRTRGLLLRLVRNRPLTMALGVLMAAPAVYVQASGRSGAWWVEGLSLVVGATGLALMWTGLTGPGPDWVDER